jgi:membrane-associated protein
MIEGLRLLLEGAMASPWLLLVIVGLAVVDALLPVVPSEALIITAGVAAAAGTQDLAAVIAAASLGSFIGESSAYAIGRWFGPAVRRWLTAGTSWAATFAHVERTLLTRGGVILLTGRYIPAGRTVAALAAGVTRFPTAQYVGYSAVGATMSAAYVALLGYFGGAALAHDPLAALLLSLAIGTGITALTGLARRRAPAAADEQRELVPA